MKRFIKLSLLTGLLSALMACQSASPYIRDRGADLGDIVRLDSEMPGAGVAVDVGPLSAGLYLGGILDERTSMTFLLGAGCDFLGHHEENRVYSDEFNQDYIRNKLNCFQQKGFITPAYGRIRLHLGAFFAGVLELNWLEAVDFLGGVFGLDIFDDDYYKFRADALQHYQEAKQSASDKSAD